MNKRKKERAAYIGPFAFVSKVKVFKEEDPGVEEGIDGKELFTNSDIETVAYYSNNSSKKFFKKSGSGSFKNKNFLWLKKTFLKTRMLKV